MIYPNVKVGNVYRSKATGPKGWKAGTRYWLVVAVTKNPGVNHEACHMLGLDKDWNIVSTTSYGTHAMADRPCLFRIKDVEQFALTLKDKVPC